MTKLSRDELLMILYESLMEYRSDLSKVIVAKKNTLEAMKVTDADMRGIVDALGEEVLVVSPLVDVVANISETLKAIEPEYLKLTKPMRH